MRNDNIITSSFPRETIHFEGSVEWNNNLIRGDILLVPYTPTSNLYPLNNKVYMKVNLKIEYCSSLLSLLLTQYHKLS